MNRFRYFITILAFLFIATFGVATPKDFLLPPPPTVDEVPEWEQLLAEELPKTKALSVDTQSRTEVVNFYYNVYMASEGIDANWTGEVENCIHGTTDQAFREAILRRINYYRAMAGLPGDITFDDTWHIKCQKGALVTIAELNLTDPHHPQPGWKCYTPDGADACGASNLAMGSFGPASIDGYMKDPGPYNGPVGHRRWVLFPPRKIMATGDTTAQNGYYYGSNCLWVFGPTGERPNTPDGYSWPPSGYVPYQLAYPRWSFSFPNADFSQATVTMTHQGADVSLAMETYQAGYGDNTIVWKPEGLPTTAPETDLLYHVTINQVKTGDVTTSFEYDAILIDPAKTPEYAGGFCLY